MMRENVLLLGVAFVWVSASTVEAKLIRYEINGQQYSYSTNNRQQTREARERIGAAKAAEAAKGRADAEAAANPLARLFGSAAQREASEAQARVHQVLTNPQGSTRHTITRQAVTAAQADVVSTSSLPRWREEGHRVSTRRQRQAALARPIKIEPVQEPKLSTPRAAPAVGLGQQARPPTITPEPVKPVASAPVVATPPAAPALPPAEPPRSRANDGGSLMDFVNQVRKAPSETPRL